jgi:hypothetical protein
LVGSTYFNQAAGFKSVVATSHASADTANLSDSSGDDTLDAGPTTAKLSGATFSNEADGFRYVYSTATTGNDVATLRDSSTGKDWFTAYPTYAVMGGTGYYNKATGFKSVTASSTGGGDIANLYDSSGNDALDAYGDYSVLAGAGFSNRANAFPTVLAYSSAGGADTANFHGSSGVETLIGRYELSEMRGTQTGGAAYDTTASTFKTVNVDALGGADKAYLFDSPSNDRLDAAANWATMTYADRIVQMTDLAALAKLSVSSSRGGSDTKHTAATDYALTVTGPWTSV